MLALLPPRIRIPDVLGVSINTHAWDGSTDFSGEPPCRCLGVLSKNLVEF